MNRSLILMLAIVVVFFGARGITPRSQAASATHVFAWGRNSDGQIGDGTSGTNRLHPVQVKDSAGTGLLGTVQSISAGSGFVLALADDNTVWTWGVNDVGQLGDGTVGGSRLLPGQLLNDTGIGALLGIDAVAAGNQHGLALASDGKVWAWGSNATGQLGNGAQGGSQPLPARVKDADGTGELSGITAVASGRAHNLALASDGTVWAWGEDNDGQDGDGASGENLTRLLPKQVKDSTGTGVLSNIIAVAAGEDTSLALSSDGKLWAWGANRVGQLGDGTDDESRSLPARVRDAVGTGVLSGIVGMAASGAHSLAVGSDGYVWAWGANGAGQLGNNDPGDERRLPVAVLDASGTARLRNIASVSASSGGNSMALGKDGSVWTWGSNFAGQLADGSSGTDRSLPGQARTASGPLGQATEVEAGATSYALVGPVRSALTATPATHSRTISVSLSGSGGHAIDGYYVSENPSALPVDSPAWSPAPITSFTLTPEDGTKTLYGFVRDDHDNVSPAATATVILDTVAPTLTFHLQRFSKAKRVAGTLRGFDANDIAGYFVSTQPLTPQASQPGWTRFRPTSFALPGADGTKKLHAWIKDVAGNVSAMATATTALDRRAPVVAITAPKRDASLHHLTTIRGTADEPGPGSGEKSGRFSIRWKHRTSCKWWNPAREKLVAGGCSKPLWFAFPKGKTWSKDIGQLEDPGSYVLAVEVRDRAGNVGKANRPFSITARHPLGLP